MTSQTNKSQGTAYPNDGMGALTNVRDWISIMIEPGEPYAPFGGLTPEEVADAFNEELLSTQTSNQRP